MKRNIPLSLFSLIFGVFSMGANAVTIIIPMRLIDQGLSYNKIGLAMSMMAAGMLIVKPIIGRHVDRIGAKRYVIAALLIGAIDLYMMSVNSSPEVYIVLNCMFGFCRGMFTSITSFYTVSVSEKKHLGNSFGNFVGISTLFTCFGGILAGVLYPFFNGTFALAIIAAIYLISALAAIRWLPDTKEENSQEKDRDSFYYLLKTMRPQVYVFGFIVFLQQFTTGPLWNTFVPLHFYTVFAMSSSFVGILMSLDELIGSPTSFLAGKISDKVSDQKFLSLSYFFAAGCSLALISAQNPACFMVCFLACGIFVTCTQIVIPKAASGFMRNANRGFEFAIISSCGGLGEWLGNIMLGDLMKSFSVNYIVGVFFISYLILSGLAFFTLRKSVSQGGR